MLHCNVCLSAGLPTIFHIFAHTVPVEERSRAFGYLVALGSVGQTVAAVVSFSSFYHLSVFISLLCCQQISFLIE